MAYKQKSEDLNNVARSMRNRDTYTKGGGDEKRKKTKSGEISQEQADKWNAKREKLETKAAEKGWSTKKQLKKGALSSEKDPTKELPEGWKGVWKKGEYVGAKEKRRVGSLEIGGGKIPVDSTPGTSVDKRKQKIDNSIKKKDYKTSQGPGKAKYLRGGKFFTKKKVGRRAGANRNIRGYKKP